MRRFVGKSKKKKKKNDLCSCVFASFLHLYCFFFKKKRVLTDHVDTTNEFRFDTGAPIRRSRICITIRRTTQYAQWLQENK